MLDKQTAHLRVVLVEPEASGRVSGGYLYNRRIAEEAPAISRVAIAVSDLTSALRELPVGPADVLLMDSLFLDRSRFAAFLDFRARTGVRLGAVLHALPSFIAACDSRELLAARLPLRPTADELAMVAALDVIVAPGPHLFRLLPEAPGQHRVLAPPGLDSRLAVPQGSDRVVAGPVKILGVGALTRHKGWLDAARALARLRRRSWVWDVVGAVDAEPEFFAEWRRALADLGIAERVTIYGQIAPDRVPPLLATADIFLHASYTENYPLVLMEAAAAGLPIAAYSADGVPDIVEDGVSGRLAPTLDIARLADGVEALMASHSLRTELGQRALARAHGWPTWAEAAAHLVDELRRVVSDSVTSRAP